MNRVLVALVAGVVLIGAMSPMAAADQPNHQQERVRREMRTDCQFNFLDPAQWTQREELITARCLVAKFSVPGGLSQLHSVISCESNWYRFANNAGNYLGLSQQHADSWRGRVSSWEPSGWRLRPAWFNSRSNLTVAVRMAHNDGDWGQWAGCA